MLLDVKYVFAIRLLREVYVRKLNCEYSNSTTRGRYNFSWTQEKKMSYYLRKISFSSHMNKPYITAWRPKYGFPFIFPMFKNSYREIFAFMFLGQFYFLYDDKKIKTSHWLLYFWYMKLRFLLSWKVLRSPQR